MEEKEREKNKKNDNDDDDTDWTPTLGGFLPNLRRRKKTVPIIQEVKTLQEYKQIVVEESDQLVVVFWYAPWCRTCKATTPKVKQLASKLDGIVKFVKVPVVPNTALLHQGLGVPTVPFGHIYHPEAGLVEELSLNKRVFRKFKETLQHYVDEECLLPASDDDDVLDRNEKAR